MSLRPTVHRDEFLETVPTIRRCGQSQPVAYGDLSNNTLEGDRWDVMTFVDDDQPVPGGELSEIFPAGETLCHGNIDDPLGPISATTELTDLLGCHAEVVSQPFSPLLDERLSIHHDQCRHPAMGDERAGDDGLSRPWRGHQDPKVMGNERVQRALLAIGQVGLQGDVDLVGDSTDVNDLKGGSGVCNHSYGLILDPTREMETVDRLAVAA